MKLLISVFSCASDSNKGNNQAIRDTWGKNLPSNVDLKFFIGVGKPGPYQDEHPNWRKDFEYQQPHKHIQPVPLDERMLRGDEVFVDAPDGYDYMAYKTRERYRYVAQNDYDFVFKADTDTYVSVPRLLQSGFEKFDYSGCKDASDGEPGYCFGGTGYMLSRRACELAKDELIYTYAEDVWTAWALQKHGVYAQHLTGFRYSPTMSGKPTTMHLGGVTGSWNNKVMYQAYRLLGV